MKNSTKLLVLEIGIAIIILLAAGWLCLFLLNKTSAPAKTPPVGWENNVESDKVPVVETLFPIKFSELFNTPTRTFYCRYTENTESDCALFYSDTGSDKKIDLNIRNEFGSFFPSPDSKHLLVVNEHDAIVLDAADLTKKTILEVGKDRVLGMYSSFPSFMAKATWVDNDTVSFAIYDAAKAFADSDPPPKPLEIKGLRVSDGAAVDASAWDPTRVACEENGKYFVVYREVDGSVGSDILVKNKMTENQFIPCAYKVGAGDFEIKNVNAEYFLDITNNFLILDSGTGPDNRKIIVYDLYTRKQVFSDTYDEFYESRGDTLKYWTPTKEKVVAENCPQLAEFSASGLGAEIQKHVSVDLLTLTKTDLGESRCQAIQ